MALASVVADGAGLAMITAHLRDLRPGLRDPRLRCNAWQPVQIPLSAAQIAMPQEPLQLVNGQTSLRLVCGVGTAQGVNTTAFFNATGCLGCVVDLLRRSDMKVSVWQ
jgi:hypothetical protein